MDYFIALAPFVFTIAGLVFGHLLATRECADQAISEAPAKWWTDALIYAKARKETQ